MTREGRETPAENRLQQPTENRPATFCCRSRTPEARETTPAGKRRDPGSWRHGWAGLGRGVCACVLNGAKTRDVGHGAPDVAGRANAASNSTMPFDPASGTGPPPKSSKGFRDSKPALSQAMGGRQYVESGRGLKGRPCFRHGPWGWIWTLAFSRLGHDDDDKFWVLDGLAINPRRPFRSTNLGGVRRSCCS